MRIIGGEFSGYRFTPPANKWPTRPTTDIAKEGLYNILTNRLDFDEMKFLDLFGGTGSHCYECISRGCNDATYVDKHGPAAAYVQLMSEKLNIKDKLQIKRMNVFKFIKTSEEQYNYIFAGPPYPLKNIADIPDMVLDAGLLSTDGLLVLEHNPHVHLDKHPQLLEQRNYGETFFSMFTIS